MADPFRGKQFALVESWIAKLVLADPGLKAGGLAVYVGIASKADDDGRSRISFLELCDFTGFSRRHAIRITEKLEEAGFVRVERRRCDEKGNQVNCYQLMVPGELAPLNARLDRLFGNEFQRRTRTTPPRDSCAPPGALDMPGGSSTHTGGVGGGEVQSADSEELARPALSRKLVRELSRKLTI